MAPGAARASGWIHDCGASECNAGRWYLDARWNAAGLVAEIDGAHHQGGANPIADALRQTAVALHGDRVLRIPDVGLRSDPDAFLDQIEAALIDAGVVEVRAP